MIRNVVRVLLLNEEQKFLLAKIDGSNWNLRKKDGSPFSIHWMTLGGKIEENEDVFSAAKREIFEEAGITDLNIGPVIWIEDYYLWFNNELAHYKNTYVVAHTKQKTLSFENFTENEKQYIIDMKWFSYDEIKESKESIHPAHPLLLKTYLPDILKGNYPKIPLNFSV